MTHGAPNSQPTGAGGAPILRATDVVKRYGEITVINGVSFDAHVGDVVTLIGSSGAGKSTLLRCLNLLEVPNGGSLEIVGEHLEFSPTHGGRADKLDRKQLRRVRKDVAMVFQQFNLWPHLSVLGNVTEVPVHVLGRNKREATERAEHYLERVGMADKRDQYPAFLSGGQQQRVAIARALAVEPKVLLFDEPTSALDPELVNEVLTVIQSLADERRTMVMVTHEMRFARHVSSKIIYLYNGKIEEEGTPEEVFENPSSARCRQFVSSVHA